MGATQVNFKSQVGHTKFVGTITNLGSARVKLPGFELTWVYRDVEYSNILNILVLNWLFQLHDIPKFTIYHNFLVYQNLYTYL